MIIFAASFIENMVPTKRLTPSEEAIMQILWKIGQGFANDIMNEIPEPKPPYNTTLSVVKKLETKGYVGHTTYGKANQYYPVVTKEQYSRNLLGRIIKNYFNNSLPDLVSTFAADHDVTQEDLDEIQKLIQNK